MADNTEAVAASIQGRTGVLQLYRSPGLSPSATSSLLRKAQARVAPSISGIDTEVVRGSALLLCTTCHMPLPVLQRPS